MQWLPFCIPFCLDFLWQEAFLQHIQSLDRNDYKVLLFVPVIDEPDKVEVKVLTLGSWIWRSIGNFVYSLRYRSRNGGIYLNGFLHWIVGSVDGSRIICAFNVERECFQELPLPPSPRSVTALNLGILKDWLSVTVCSYTKIIVWVMKDYGCNESWTKELEISGTTPFFKQVIEHTEDGKALLLDKMSLTLEVYTPGRKGLDQMLRLDSLSMASIFPYIPSFASIRDITGCPSSKSSS
ncbi:putative F-box associated interaction domain-containing protein [Rosa chinensis]|uniref:Putative F-box associated interaction domain-containing protein n=1 Tax=Rosa chinensis TaxID=74649 RepID=A0A2P6Q944_ROSCH|nr:putative F-box associated interaction domain-containing protein [Rosa chinensis]